MKENGLSNIRSKYASLEKREPQHIQDAIKSRRLYNETRGTQFQSDTMVVRNRNIEAQPNAPQPESRRPSQNTMGLFRTSSGGRSGGKSYSSFFDRMLKDAQTGGDPSANRQKGGSSSWVKGMSSSVSSDKRDALERQLKRVAQLELASKQSSMAPLQSEVQTVQTVPAQQPAAASPLQPLGSQIPGIISEQQAAQQVHDTVQEPLIDSRAVRAALAQPVNRALFSSIRGRIGNLVMHDLPADVTSELRQIARELDQLNSSTNS